MNELETVVEAISEKKGEQIMVYDVREISPLMDSMIVASSRNLRQNQAIAQNIKDRLYEQGYEGPFRIEGNEHSNWLLIDLGDIVAHIFTNDERANYALDRLYQDCKKYLYE